jgi:hypothetical protein
MIPSLSAFIDYFRTNSGKQVLLFFFFLSMTLGSSFALFSDYIYKEAANPDIDTYLGLSHFDFDQSPIRRYRVIVPFLAAGLHSILHPVLSVIQPNSFPGPDFGMGFCFLVVNNLIMAGAFLLVFKTARFKGLSFMFSMLSVLFILSCRWTLYVCGLPLVDSLYFLVLSGVLYAIATQNTAWSYAMIFLGPWAKESFIFIAPLLFFFGPISKIKQVPYWLLSAIVIFTYRYVYDHWVGVPIEESMTRDLAHFGFIGESLQRLFSFHGVYEILSIVGLGGVSFLLLWNPQIRSEWKKQVRSYEVLYILIIVFHALLSTDLARMFYLTMPVLGIWMASLLELAKGKMIGRPVTP